MYNNISQMVSELVESVLSVRGDNVKQIILYGSVARHEETDVILILH